jgi:cytidylate kinase
MQIITIDGPASSGKGTVARLIAKKLRFHYLESGAIYRVIALVTIRYGLTSNDINQILDLINKVKLEFYDDKVLVNGEDVTVLLRAEEVGMMASSIAKVATIRERLLDFQRGFAVEPGLVTDGRDMGSIVFPNADLKVFLTASAEIRAARRYQQLKQPSANYDAILADIVARDKQDSERATAPLTYDSSFVLIDNGNMTVDETVEKIISRINRGD